MFEYCRGLLEIPNIGDLCISVPIGNYTGFDVALLQGTVLRTLQRREKIVDSQRTSGVRQTAETQEGGMNKAMWHPPVDLGHLSDSQCEVIQKMLYEEFGTFSKGDNDIRCIPSLQMSTADCLLLLGNELWKLQR